MKTEGSPAMFSCAPESWKEGPDLINQRHKTSTPKSTTGREGRVLGGSEVQSTAVPVRYGARTHTHTP